MLAMSCHFPEPHHLQRPPMCPMHPAAAAAELLLPARPLSGDLSAFKVQVDAMCAVQLAGCIGCCNLSFWLHFQQQGNGMIVVLQKARLCVDRLMHGDKQIGSCCRVYDDVVITARHCVVSWHGVPQPSSPSLASSPHWLISQAAPFPCLILSAQQCPWSGSSSHVGGLSSALPLPPPRSLAAPCHDPLLPSVPSAQQRPGSALSSQPLTLHPRVLTSQRIPLSVSAQPVSNLSLLCPAASHAARCFKCSCLKH